VKFVPILPAALFLGLGLFSELLAADAKVDDREANLVKRLVIIVHPCPYEIYHRPAPGSPLYPYREMEKAVFARWLEAVDKLPATTFVVQIDMPETAAGPDRLHAACVDHLGPTRVCRVKGEYQYPEKPVPLLNYYGRIHKQVTEQFEQNGLIFDSAHCDTELWGQSFEGCAPGYGTALCRRLGLQQPFRFDYGKSVPDARFLLNLRRWETVNLGDSDVVAYLFDLNDGSSAALFQSRKEDQWLDRRPIELRLDPSRFWVSDKQGKTIWPKDKETDPQHVVRLMSSEEHFLRTRGADSKALKEVVRNGHVGPAPKE
jgi:hypothetical protein